MRVRAERTCSGRSAELPARSTRRAVCVTARRIGFIAEIYQDLGLPPAAARRRAIICYATYLGWLDLRCGPADIVPEIAPGPSGTATIDEAMRILLDGVA